MVEIDNIIEKYIDLGFQIFPVNPKSKIPMFSRWNEIKTPDEMQQIFIENNDANIGLHCGKASGITVIDCDSSSAYNKLVEAFGCDTLTSKTSKGYHLFFQYEEGIDNAVRVESLKEYGDIDIRSDNGFVVIPPSIHESGVQYEWTNKKAPQRIPDGLRDRIKNNKTGNFNANKELLKRMEGVQEGSRNDTAATLAGKYLGKGFTAQETLVHLRMWNKENKPPLNDDELINVVSSITKLELTKQCTEESIISGEGFNSYVPAIQKKIQRFKECKDSSIKTGYPKIDNFIFGLEPEELILVVAEPNVGKTASMLYMAYSNALRGKRALYFSTETSRNYILDRIVSIFYGVPAFHLRTGNFTDGDLFTIKNKALPEIKSVPFFVCDVDEPDDKFMERCIKKYTPEVLFLDYFQACPLGNDAWHARDFVKSLKRMANQYHIPVVVGSQTNVGMSYYSSKEGKMIKPEINPSQVRSTLALHHISDIMFAMNKKRNEVTGDEYIKFSIVKARNCPRGDFYLKFDKPFLRFEEVTKEQYEIGLGGE